MYKQKDEKKVMREKFADCRFDGKWKFCNPIVIAHQKNIKDIKSWLMCVA